MIPAVSDIEIWENRYNFLDKLIEMILFYKMNINYYICSKIIIYELIILYKILYYINKF